MTRNHLPCVFAAGLLLTGGCLNFDLDTDAVYCGAPAYAFPTAAITAPLAVGARVSVFVGQVNAEGNITETLTVESSNPGVILVETEEDPMSATLRAVAEGSADVIVRRQNGMEHGRVTLTVLPVTSYLLYSRRALLAGDSVDEAQVTVPRIIPGTRATFFVRAFSDATEVQIDGTLLSIDLRTPGSVALFPLSTASATLSASQLGEHDAFVELRSTLLTPLSATQINVPVLGVSPDSVTSLEFEGLMEEGAEEDECLTAVALPRDADGEVVEGATARFTDDDNDGSLGDGETLSYHYHAAHTLRARATVGTTSATTTLHTTARGARGGSVSSCAAGRGGDTSAMIAIGVALCVVLGRRTRRAA